MLVRPCGVAARVVDDTEYRVGPYELPGIDRRAAVHRITGQAIRIDRGDSSVRQPSIRCAAVELALLKIDPLLIFGGRAVRDAGRATTARDAIAGGYFRRCEHAVVSDVVKRAHRLG